MRELIFLGTGSYEWLLKFESLLSVDSRSINLYCVGCGWNNEMFCTVLSADFMETCLFVLNCLYTQVTEYDSIVGTLTVVIWLVIRPDWLVIIHSMND